MDSVAEGEIGLIPNYMAWETACYDCERKRKRKKREREERETVKRVRGRE